MTVNHDVAGSSPAGGARNRGQFRSHLNCPIFMRFLSIFEEIRVTRVKNMVNIAFYNKSKYNKSNTILSEVNYEKLLDMELRRL